MIILTGRRILLYDNVLRPGFIYRRNIVKSIDIIVNGKQKCLDNVYNFNEKNWLFCTKLKRKLEEN